MPTPTPPAPVPAPDPPPGESKKPFSLEELGLVGTILAAIGGGLGLLGFVAFFGAAILWIRMTEAGLPGDEAVAVIPKPVLISTGAGFLVPALLVALGFTVLVFLLDFAAKWKSETPLRSLRADLRQKREEERGCQRSVEAFEQAVALATSWSEGSKAAFTLGTGTETQAEDAEARRKASQVSLHSAKARQLEVQEEIGELEKQLHDLEGAGRESMENQRTGLLVGLTVILFVAGATAVIVDNSIALGPLRVILLAIGLGLLITVVVAVRIGTKSFGWFAVATFVAVGLVLGALTYLRTKDEPKIEPAAVLRSHGAPVYGFYVAQTSDRVYLGTTSPGNSVRLDSIPREEVLDLLVGGLEPPAAATERALFYARNLCLRARERRATGKIAGSDGGGSLGEEMANGCTARDLSRIKAAVVH